VWRAPFPRTIQNDLITTTNPTGRLTNSDLELAALIVGIILACPTLIRKCLSLRTILPPFHGPLKVPHHVTQLQPICSNIFLRYATPCPLPLHLFLHLELLTSLLINAHVVFTCLTHNSWTTCDTCSLASHPGKLFTHRQNYYRR
jgi:hypothetical protein